jgi:hypothetical protein
MRAVLHSLSCLLLWSTTWLIHAGNEEPPASEPIQQILSAAPGETRPADASEEPAPPRHLTHTIAERRLQPLSPELETKLAQIAENCLPEQKKFIKQHMDRVVQRIEQTVQITPEQKAALQKAADDSIEKYLLSWKPAFIGALRLTYDRPNIAEIASRWTPQHRIQMHPLPEPLLPDSSPEWNAALASTLAPEALAQWLQSVQAKQAEKDQAIQNFLNPHITAVRKAMKNALDAHIVDINTFTKAPIEKIHAIEKLVPPLIDALAQPILADLTALQRNIPKFTVPRNSLRFDHGAPLDFPSILLDQQFASSAAKILSPDELAAWQTGARQRDENLRRKLAENTRPLAEQYRESFHQQFQQEVNSITLSLDLSDERKQQLEKASQDALDDYFNDWREALVKHLLTLTESQREEILQGQRGFSLGITAENQPRKHPAWEKRKSEILTPEESQRWKSSLEERRHRISHAYAELFIAEIDKQVALSSSQRATLLPITRKLVDKQLEQFGFGYTTPTHFHQSYFFSMSESEDGKELANLLTPKQWEHWKSLRERQRQPSPTPSPDVSGLDPETIIARHLHFLDQQERRQRLSQIQMHLDEAARIATLSDEAAARLLTAAKGAVDANMESWRKNLSNYVRHQTRQTSPEALQQRLVGLGTMRFTNNEPQPSDHPIWKTAVVELLPEDRRQTWRDEQTARQNYFIEAIAANVLAQLNQQATVSPAHAEILRPHIIKVLADHQHEFLAWFSEGWYYSPHQVLTPVCGIPEDEIKKVFSEKVFAALREGVLSQGQSYWDSIKHQREQRLKNEERQRRAK